MTTIMKFQSMNMTKKNVVKDGDDKQDGNDDHNVGEDWDDKQDAAKDGDDKHNSTWEKVLHGNSHNVIKWGSHQQQTINMDWALK